MFQSERGTIGMTNLVAIQFSRGNLSLQQIQDLPSDYVPVQTEMEKNQKVVCEWLLQNKCVDCNGSPTEKVDVIRGTFICSKCSGGYRSMDQSITGRGLRTPNIESITDAELESFKRYGNVFINELYESKKDDTEKAREGFRRCESQNNGDLSKRHRFIKNKYQHGLYIMEAKRASLAEYNWKIQDCQVHPPTLKYTFKTDDNNYLKVGGSYSGDKMGQFVFCQSRDGTMQLQFTKKGESRPTVIKQKGKVDNSTSFTFKSWTKGKYLVQTGKSDKMTAIFNITVEGRKGVFQLKLKSGEKDLRMYNKEVDLVRRVLDAMQMEAI